MCVVARIPPSGCLPPAAAAWAHGSGTTTFTYSSAEIGTYNTTNVTEQVNTFQVALKARLQGVAVVFDQTATTTNTFQTSQFYELDGFATSFVAVPAPSQWDMLLLAGLLAGAAALESHRRMRRRPVASAPSSSR